MVRRALLAALIVLAAPAVRAEEDARAVNQRAVAAFALGQYGEAADLWEKCFAMKPQPALLYNAAQAQRLAGHKERALLLYENYLRLYGRVVQNRAEVERHVQLLSQAIETDQRVANAPPVGPEAAAGERAAEKAPPPRQAPRHEAQPPVKLDAPPVEAPPAVALVETKREPAPSRRNLWIGLGVAAGAVAVVAVVLGVVLGATSDPTPTRGTISFGGL
jgi:tetratricopeptide (TPR) repeat protein